MSATSGRARRVTPKVFEGAVDASGGAHLNGTVLTYAVGYYEGDLLKSRVTTLDLSSGAEESYDWDRLVYSPMRSGKYHRVFVVGVGRTR